MYTPSLWSFLFLILTTDTAVTSGEFPSFGQLWSLTCEITTFVSRSKRSIVEELPDIHNAKETFDYLFPLANVQDFPSEGNLAGEGRSHQSIPTASVWLDDLVDLWRFECQRRREDNTNKHRGHKAQGRSDSHKSRGKRDVNPGLGLTPADVVSWTNYFENFTSTPDPSSSLSKQRWLFDDDDDEEDALKEDDNKYVKEDDEVEDEEEDEEEEDEEVTTTTKQPEEKTVAPTTPPEPPEDDPYFASYGGDIEYFFPLISFTIPFDGQITLLGFHGFKGMFPY